MTDPTPPLVRRRILVALDTSPFGLLAVDLAGRLAAELHSELEGLFYEDVNLLKLSDLPFAREVGHTSQAGRQLNRATMERLMRIKAQEIRRSMAQSCSQLNLPWSLKIIRQRVLPHALESAREADLLMLGIESRLPRATIPLHQSRSTGGSIILLYDGSTASHRALEIANRAAQHGGSLIIQPVAANAQKARELVQQARQQAAHAKINPWPAQSSSDIIEAVHSRRAKLVIAPWHSSLANEQSLTRLLAELGCVVMLVR